jgi:hypothetical protein
MNTGGIYIDRGDEVKPCPSRVKPTSVQNLQPLVFKAPLVAQGECYFFFPYSLILFMSLPKKSTNGSKIQ